MTIMDELWDTESRNIVAVFGSRAEALSSVRLALRTHGRAAVGILALGTEDGDGGGEVIARGAGLADLAERESTQQGTSQSTASSVRRGVPGKAVACKQSKSHSGTWAKRHPSSGSYAQRTTGSKSGVRAKYQHPKKNGPSKRER